MEKIKEKCIICNSDIDEYAYYLSEGGQYFCREECVEKSLDGGFGGVIWDIQYCPGYDYCKQLGNLRKNCYFRYDVTKNKSPADYISKSYIPKWCPPAEVSHIISDAKLFNFVKSSEESSSKLNLETLNQNKLTNKLTWVMLGVSLANLFLIGVQIYLQIFCK